MNGKTVTRLFLFLALLILPLASCRGGETPPIPQMPTGTYTETRLPLFSSTPPTPSTTPSIAPTLTTTSTALPTFSYPITPGPIINRENAGRLALLGAVYAKTSHADVTNRIRHQLDWSPDGREIVLASDGDGIRFIDPLNMKDIGGITEVNGELINYPGTVVYNPDGKSLVMTIPAGLANKPGPIIFIDSQTHIENHKSLDVTETLMITYNRTGKRMAVGSRYHISVYDFTLDKWIWDIGENNGFFDFVSFSWDDRYLAFTGEYGGGIVNTDTWESLKIFDDMDMSEPLCFSRDSKYYARLPGIWSMNDFTLRKGFSEGYTFDTCEFGKENDIVINLEEETKVQIWDVETGEILTEITGQQGSIYDMALSPDGRFLATAEGFENPMLKIWGIPA